MEKENQWLHVNWNMQFQWEEGISKVHEESMSDGYTDFLDSSNGFMTVYMLQNLSNCTHKYRQIIESSLYSN